MSWGPDPEPDRFCELSTACPEVAKLLADLQRLYNRQVGQDGETPRLYNGVADAAAAASASQVWVDLVALDLEELDPGPQRQSMC